MERLDCCSCGSLRYFYHENLFGVEADVPGRGMQIEMTGAITKEKSWSGNEIREAFLRFFESKGHRRVRSSSLVPHGDPTLLFTNAGMNQFKDVFLGLEKRDYTRATTAQKCVRAGGKHNDLENVGFTKRHHTFFEMLGNFSFGDYFKEKAIPYAWELVTSPQWFAIPKEKLYVTIFNGRLEIHTPSPDMERDEPARQIWLGQGIGADRIFACGAEENFWAMGDTGPCGPCSEIHYDIGQEASDLGHTDCKFPCDCGRYVEIWNLVFMQYNREASGFTRLSRPSIDTGMGLERIASVLQRKISNYDTDLFQGIIEKASQRAKIRYGADERGDISLRVIADHTRAATFLISDGVTPANDRRGYVLRKILRRAIRHGRLLDIGEPFLYKLVPTVVDEMKDAYPELASASDRISNAILAEENQFGRTLTEGWKRMEAEFTWLVQPHTERINQFKQNPPSKEIAELVARPNIEKAGGLRRDVAILSLSGTKLKFPGDEAFKLSDTFGVPRDFIEDSARDIGFEFDATGYESALAEQRARSRASWKGGAKEAANPAYAKLAEKFKTEPAFYFGTTAKDSHIEAIILTGGASRADTKNGPVNELKAGESGEVVLNRTAIYAESGGQVADTGAFYDNSESQLLAEVKSAFYPVAGLVAHKVVAKETLRVGDRVTVVADAERHARIIRNHTGTHLVNAALRNILGTHVKQSGSLNAPDRLRFDFSHFAHVDAEELRDIEQQVNEEIRLNTQIETNVTSLEDALASGALAFFGDKYPEQNVRVVTIPDPRAARGFYSKELCGGTHVQRVGDIGVLKIVSEESVAAGVRRIEAVTGIGALEHFQKQADILRHLASQLNVGEDGILAQLEKLSQTAKQLEKELEAQKRKGALSQIDELAGRVQLVKGIKVIAAEVQNVDREGLRQLVDSLRQKLGSGVVALGMPEDGKVALIAGVTKDLTTKVHAGKLIQALAKQVGGSGGGRPDLAEAGGKDTAGLKSALLSIPSLLEGLL
jgi:alanyl-tRNA synthetase